MVQSRNRAIKVCPSTRRIAVVDYAPENSKGAARVEVYKSLAWDMGASVEYELQKIADVYPSSVEQLDNVIHCFGIVWENSETVEDALDVLTHEHWERLQLDLFPPVIRRPLG